VFGVAYGGVMPLYALVLREYFGTATISTAYGAVYGISSLGMGLGSLAGGWFYDALGSYQWLFVSSAALGLMGMVLALALTPPRLPGYVLSAPR
jgi:MFS family permease